LGREKTEEVRVIMKMNVERRRERGIPKKRLSDTVEGDMRAAGVCVEDDEDRDKWRSRTRVADPKQLGRRRRRYSYCQQTLWELLVNNQNAS